MIKYYSHTYRHISIIVLIYLLTISCDLNAQYISLSDVQEELKIAARKVYPACIRAYGIDTVSQRQISGQFSGVVVTPDGYILTVAHAIQPGLRYKVSFPDGREGFARGMGRIVTNRQTNRPDVAMMKMEGDGPWDYAEMGISSSLFQGDLAFGLSYPESLNLLKPALRFGRIVTPMDQWGFLESTTIMEAGDSGGALFDMAGKVIGIHSSIGEPEGVSYEVPIEMYQRYWTALTKAVNYDRLPEPEDSVFHKSITGNLMAHMNWRNIQAKRKLNSQNKAVIEIFGTTDSINRSILGTVFTLKTGKQVVVGKSSSIGNAPFYKVGNQKMALEVMHRDVENDLVAMQSAVGFDFTLDLQTLPCDTGAIIERGTLAYTLMPDSVSDVCVIAMEQLPLRAFYSAGHISADLQAIHGYPTIIGLDSVSPALKAGMMVGDRIFKINDVYVNSALTFNEEMEKHYPGEQIAVGYLRGKDTLSSMLTLVPRVFREHAHAMNMFKGGKSQRRDGFRSVFVHDGRIHAYECGAPMFALDGSFLGLNIARFSHSACIALDSRSVLGFLQRLM